VSNMRTGVFLINRTCLIQPRTLHAPARYRSDHCLVTTILRFSSFFCVAIFLILVFLACFVPLYNSYRIVPKLREMLACILRTESKDLLWNRRSRNLPKRLLDTPDIVLAPVPLRDLLLADRNAAPADPHDRHVVHVVLVKVDL
jgi:hypothetical protein